MKRINIEVEVEGVILATSELEARKALSQELSSEVPWVVTHSTSVGIEALHPTFFNTIDVWCEGYDYVEEGEEVDMDFYVSVGLNALVGEEQDLSVLEGELTTALRDNSLVEDGVESVVVTISETNS